jgi:hypothetical protein
MHNGSNLRNEFKSAVQQLVLSNYYDIFPHSNFPNPEHANHYIAGKVQGLLNKKAGMWMHKNANIGDIMNNQARNTTLTFF